ncbi:unnamed protein product [Tilletia caries]|nr:unnamed protein product [Tilletia caries]
MDGVKPGRTYADFANAAASGGGIIIIAFLLVFPSRICAHNDLDGGAHYAIDPATGLPRNLSALLISNVWPKSGIIPPLRSAGRVQTHDLPFRIALPHIVIRELDGFKTGGRSDSVRIAARQANRWILAYLQGQKRSVSTFLSKDAFEMIMRAAIAAGGAPTDVAAAAEATIAALNPPEAWALHFETARQHKERMKEDPAGQGEAE